MHVKSVGVTANFYQSGEIVPCKFSLDGKPFSVDELVEKYVDRRNGNAIRCFKYKRMDGKTYELKFELDTMKWKLWME